MNTITAASFDLEPLDSFVGAWDTEGVVHAGANATPIPFTAKDTYEWLAGGHFLLHHFDAAMPEGHVSGLEIIGYDAENGCFVAQSYDSLGGHAAMQLRAIGERWEFIGTRMRFSGKFCEQGLSLTGQWEMQEPETDAWRVWIDVRLRRAG